MKIRPTRVPRWIDAADRRSAPRYDGDRARRKAAAVLGLGERHQDQGAGLRHSVEIGEQLDLKMVGALAGGFDEGTLDEARRQAMVAALTLIGALTVSRVVTDQALSDAILRSAQDSITGSQTTGGKKAKRGG